MRVLYYPVGRPPEVRFAQGLPAPHTLFDVPHPTEGQAPQIEATFLSGYWSYGILHTANGRRGEAPTHILAHVDPRIWAGICGDFVLVRVRDGNFVDADAEVEAFGRDVLEPLRVK